MEKPDTKGLPIIMFLTNRGDQIQIATNDEDDLIESVGENVRDMLDLSEVTEITLKIIR